MRLSAASHACGGGLFLSLLGASLFYTPRFVSHATRPFLMSRATPWLVHAVGQQPFYLACRARIQRVHPVEHPLHARRFAAAKVALHMLGAHYLPGSRHLEPAGRTLMCLHFGHGDAYSC